MANEEQLSILKQGVEVWNKWRKEHTEMVIDFKEAGLREAVRATSFWTNDLHRS